MVIGSLQVNVLFSFAPVGLDLAPDCAALHAGAAVVHGEVGGADALGDRAGLALAREVELRVLRLHAEGIGAEEEAAEDGNGTCHGNEGLMP